MNTTHHHSSTVRAGALAAGLLLVTVACGSDDDGSDTADTTAASDVASPTTEAAGGNDSTVASESSDTAAEAGPVGVASTGLGDVLVDSEGFSLYGFTPDESGSPTCVDDCADAWPPFVLDDDALPAGLDDAVFSVSERPDGSFQLAAGGWPLYRFAADAAPGDTNGQGVGGVWFVVAPDGGLIETEAGSSSDDGDIAETTLLGEGY